MSEEEDYLYEEIADLRAQRDDLLAALEELCDVARHFGEFSELTAAREAIAKAKGV